MANRFIAGMDVSFLDEIEQAGGLFYENGIAENCLAIMKGNGVNAIRLRIWNDPPGGMCNLARTAAIAKRVKAQGMSLLLDFHYSDVWADPAHQTKPAAWQHLSFEELGEAVYSYTKGTLEALRAEGALPDMVQVGNEITPGMLWDEGKVDGELNTDSQWSKFASLVQQGIQAVRDTDTSIAVMIHIDRGGDNPSSRSFYDRFEQLGVEFDVIGLSYYPWWHGTLDQLRANLHDLALRYGKPILVVETAYPWTLDGEGKQFIVASEQQLHAGYPASPEGQEQFLADLIRLIKETPGGKGIGFYYWEPCWIPVKKEWSVGHANNWSNLTLFDFEGRKLQGLSLLVNA
ncbi:glycoside hydrolase family 53 protein [Paenibacillus protaetiae]|uniref:Arabinogalactan endo-beta-1,4-galactanase n=1 Tax=Paenibacillus protaetiae TaxID=2509456 RepID=A0A4P6F4C4_9BACL|nr:arabinogalactan endo-1,4-beta-galactosidase [Paenibacillus protaetiae]QAY68027.1 antitoxin [Paenibacillus protaetiae]